MHKEHPIEKIYFDINEISLFTGEPQSTIRYWDAALKITKKRTSGGHRKFTARDVDAFLKLSKVKGDLTIKGMKKYLNGKLKIELL